MRKGVERSIGGGDLELLWLSGIKLRVIPARMAESELIDLYHDTLRHPEDFENVEQIEDEMLRRVWPAGTPSRFLSWRPLRTAH